MQDYQQNHSLGVHGHVAVQVREFNDPSIVARHGWKFTRLAEIKAALKQLETDWDTAYFADDDPSCARTIAHMAQLEQELSRLHSSLPTMTDANSTVVREDDWDNLILDSGLDQLATQSTTGVFTFCAVGTGNATPVVSQQGLVSESARTGNYLTSGGGCGTTQPNNYTWVHKRTFDFPLGALNGTYAEVGFSPSSSAGANLYNRSLIQSSGVPTAVTVSLTQQLRVVFTHTVTVAPLTITRNVPEINGWTIVTSSGATTASQTATTVTASSGIFTAGDVNKAIKFANGTLAVILGYTSATIVTVDRSQSVAAQTFSVLSGTTGADQIQSLGGLIGSVDVTGFNNPTGLLEPGQNSIPGFVSASSTALPSTAGTGVDRSGSANTSGTYAAQTYLGGFTRDWKMSFTVNQANHIIRSFGASNFNYAAGGTLVTLLDADQTKSSLYTLDLVLTINWNRN